MGNENADRRKPIGSDGLERVLAEVAWQVDIVAELALRMVVPPPWTHNAMDDRRIELDAFLLGVRRLTEFFLSKPSPTYVRAHDFLPNWQAVDAGPAGDVLRRHRNSLDVALAHITLFHTGPGRLWPVSELREAILHVTRLFVAELESTNSPYRSRFRTTAEDALSADEGAVAAGAVDHRTAGDRRPHRGGRD